MKANAQPRQSIIDAASVVFHFCLWQCILCRFLIIKVHLGWVLDLVLAIIVEANECSHSKDESKRATASAYNRRSYTNVVCFFQSLSIWLVVRFCFCLMFWVRVYRKFCLCCAGDGAVYLETRQFSVGLLFFCHFCLWQVYPMSFLDHQGPFKISNSLNSTCSCRRS